LFLQELRATKPPTNGVGPARKSRDNLLKNNVQLAINKTLLARATSLLQAPLKKERKSGKTR